MWSDSDHEQLRQEMAEFGWILKEKLGDHKPGSAEVVYHAHRVSAAPSSSTSGTGTQHAAIKVFPVDQNGEDCGRYLYNDIMHHLQLFHPHIIQFRSLVATPEHLCLVMEYANQGNLFTFSNKSKGLPEAAARFIFQQLLLVLDYCHSVEVFIRDIKPSNLLVVWDQSGMPLVKLKGFSFAKNRQTDGPAKTAIGYSKWMSPHVARNQRKNYGDKVAYGPICDIWSAAVTLYYLLYNAWPFSDESIKEWSMEGGAVRPGLVHYPERNAHGPVSQEVRELMQRIFACGNLETIEEYHAAGGVTLDEIKATWWFQVDLPAGALDMKAACHPKTRARVACKEYKLLKAAGEAAAAECLKRQRSDHVLLVDTSEWAQQAARHNTEQAQASLCADPFISEVMRAVMAMNCNLVTMEQARATGVLAVNPVPRADPMRVFAEHYWFQTWNLTLPVGLEERWPPEPPPPPQPFTPFATLPISIMPDVFEDVALDALQVVHIAQQAGEHAWLEDDVWSGWVLPCPQG